MTSKLSGKVALVTGGSAGIGLGVAKRFAEEGARVFITGRRQSELDKAVTAIGGGATAVQGDISNLDDLDHIYATIKDKAGRIDVLAVNAGYYEFGSFGEITEQHFDKIFNTNVRGVYYCIRSFAPMMIRARRGHIINISSLAGKNALPNGAAYSASKWALNGLSYSVAEELRNYNIRVSVVCPGSVHTEFSPHVGKDSNKMLQPEDVAHVVAMIVTQSPTSFASEILLRPTMKP